MIQGIPYLLGSRLFWLNTMLFGVGCIQFDYVQADPPKYHPRTEIDFEKIDVQGTLQRPDPIPELYDGVPRYYDTTGLITSNTGAPIPPI